MPTDRESGLPTNAPCQHGHSFRFGVCEKCGTRRDDSGLSERDDLHPYLRWVDDGCEGPSPMFIGPDYPTAQDAAIMHLARRVKELREAVSRGN